MFVKAALFFILLPILCIAEESPRLPTARIESPAIPNDTAIMNIRVRPLGLVSQVFGAEFGLIFLPRFELGPSVHYFHNSNDVRSTNVNAWELGLKASSLVLPNAFREGVYLSGAAYVYLTQVQQTIGGELTSTGHFRVPGASLVLGYQWNLNIRKTDIWTLRLGGGLGYRKGYSESIILHGKSYLLGARPRLDPTLELTIGAAI